MKYTSEYFTEPDNALIKSIYDYGMDQLVELFQLEHDADLLDIDLNIFQDGLVLDLN